MFGGNAQDPSSPAGAITLPDALATDTPWLKLWVDWPTVQKTSGASYNFSELDRQITWIRQNNPGLPGRAIILGLTQSYPGWANGGQPPTTPPVDRSPTGPWAALVRALLTRYSFLNSHRTSYFTYIDALELFNEPNQLMPGTKAAIVSAVATMMATAHSVQQSAGILPGWPALMAPAVSDTGGITLKAFTVALVSELKKLNYDASNTWWTIHNYADVKNGTCKAPAEALSALTGGGWSGLGMSTVPPQAIWITESGARLSEAGGSVATQASRIEASLANLANDATNLGRGVAATSNYLDISAEGTFNDTGLRASNQSPSGPYGPWQNRPSVPAPPPPPSPFNWSGWESLGGQLIAAPAISSLGPGKLDVFVAGVNQAVWHSWFDASLGWSGFSLVPGVSATTDSPASTSWSGSRVDLFVRGTDNALWHTFYEGSSWIGVWETLDGTLTSAPAASHRSSGVLDVFVRGIDNALWHIFYTPGLGWQGFETLGGVLTGGPASVSWASNRVDVFVPGIDRALYHKFYIEGSGWSAWESLGGVLATGTSPCVSSLSSGKLDVFTVGEENVLYHRWYSEGTGWSSWESLGGKLLGRPASVSWSSTRVDVVAQGTDNSLYHKYWGA